MGSSTSIQQPMRKKSTHQSAFFTRRALLTLLLCAPACSIVTGTLLAFFRPEAPSKVSQRTLTFAERVAYQYAIEEVYWRHRIWPKENPGPKQALDAIVSQHQIEQKVEDYLCKSQLVTAQRELPITASELQAEMDRIAKHTNRPAMLRELFEGLGHDPFVIAECLARPILAERLAAGASVVAGVSPALTGSSAADTAASTGNRIRATTNVNDVQYKLPAISVATACTDDTWTATTTVNAPDVRADQTAVWTGSEMIVWGGRNCCTWFNSGGRYNPSTDSWTATSTINAPEARWDHTVEWTGSEMIVWGGTNNTIYLNTGAKYNPTNNSWTPTTTANAPLGRVVHTSICSGSEMMVWGGTDSTFNDTNTGGRYKPTTDDWSAISTNSAPSPRASLAAVWSD